VNEGCGRKIGPYPCCTIITGDARELAPAIPDESVDLIFTDPVYDRIEDYRWLGETAARVLREGGDVLAYSGGYYLGPAIAALIRNLTYRWLLVEKKLTSGSKIWTYRLFNHYVPLIWCGKGAARQAPNRIDFMWSHGEGKQVNHAWGKGELRAATWLTRFSLPGDMLWEPFCGGGSIVSAQRRLGRHYLAFEIDPDVAERARERVRNTQPPLFVMQPEQAAMELGE